MGSSSAAFPSSSAESWIRSLIAKTLTSILIWDAGLARESLTHCATMPYIKLRNLSNMFYQWSNEEKICQSQNWRKFYREIGFWSRVWRMGWMYINRWMQFSSLINIDDWWGEWLEPVIRVSVGRYVANR